MKHIVNFSGGIGSYMAAKRVVERYGVKDTLLLFTDTKTEDEDLYRFLVETALNIYGVENEELLNMARQVPKLEYNEEARSRYLDQLAESTRKVLPNFIWLSDGRNVWEIFEHKKFIGNSHHDPCSKMLKRDLSDRFVKENFKPDECIRYLGIDWSEIHRYERAKPKFLPYQMQAPMCDEPYLSKEDMFEELRRAGIEVPRLYRLGFSHNNCGGFCIKAGLGHFRNLLDKMPERYLYHEQMEQQLRKDIGRENMAFLRKSVKGKRQYISMQELRVMEKTQLTLDEINDHGGCGCFLDDSDIPESFFDGNEKV